ncbi:MAG TPA: SUMF1/EgtB/PvdO family nonheme iron enzyme [Polyangiaceae bacterium]|nr:SUMF1/EgtB/PvdO family nonheme iron enzyme [Polyangiaceae bacterium]
MRARLFNAWALGAISLVQGVVVARALTALYPVASRGVFALGGQVGASFLARPAAASPARAPGAPQAPSIELASIELHDPPQGAPACPAEMVLVEGEYCTDVQHECKHWLESEGRYAYYRCAEYTKATCVGRREHKRFCIDRDEYARPGEKVPASVQSWTDADATCSALGKRVCLESEWQFACEGEEMRPYPYGWTRDAAACNADRVDIYTPTRRLRDLRAGPDDHPRCVSPFGVHHLSGNLEEWTTIDGSDRHGAPRPAMKGAYWQPSRNNCRANQTAHDRFYKGTETGFRCCAEAFGR